MDPLSVVKDVKALISQILKVYNLFKNRDKYLESCKVYMNSFAESLETYEASNIGIKNKSLSYEDLKKDLLEYISFLEAQKKKNVLFQNIFGSDFTVGSENISIGFKNGLPA